MLTTAPAGNTTRPPWIPIAIAAVVSVLIRLRAFWTPVTSDEGGFLAIARAWAHGKVLYRDVWVDRPQGLLAIFRVWDWVSGGSVASLRIMAMLFGAALVVGVGLATTSIAGRNAGALAAILAAISTASPAIEGHLANGELISGAFAVAGFAAACRAVQHGGPASRLFVLSGVFGGLALSVKQSGYEGIIAIGLWLLIAAVAGWRTWWQAARSIALVAGGVLAVIAVLAIHGALTGFSRWWFAFAGYRLGNRSALEGADWDRFFTTARVARPVIWPLLAMVVVGLIATLASRRGWWHHSASPASATSPPPVGPAPTSGLMALLVVWAVSAAIAFVTGGQFHRHYWITLCPSLAALAACVLCRHLRGGLAFAIALVALVPTYVNTAKILRVSNEQFPIVASDDGRPSTDERLASWFLGVRQPSDRLYVMCASAAFYANADQDPVFPYLWEDNVQMVPGALPALRTLLSSDASAPRFIAVYENPDTCDPSGATAAILRTHYERATDVAGVAVLERIGA